MNALKSLLHFLLYCLFGLGLLLYVLLVLFFLIGCLLEIAEFEIRNGDGFSAIFMISSFINGLAYLLTRIKRIREIMSRHPWIFAIIKVTNIHVNLLTVACGFVALLIWLCPDLSGMGIWMTFAGFWLVGRLLMCWYYWRHPVGADVIVEEIS